MKLTSLTIVTFAACGGSERSSLRAAYSPPKPAAEDQDVPGHGLDERLSACIGAGESLGASRCRRRSRRRPAGRGVRHAAGKQGGRRAGSRRSATVLTRSNRNGMASTISASLASTTASTRSLIPRRGSRARELPAVGDRGLDPDRDALARPSERLTSSPASGSTPTRAAPQRLAAVAQPDIRPPPPTSAPAQVDRAGSRSARARPPLAAHHALVVVRVDRHRPRSATSSAGSCSPSCV